MKQKIKILLLIILLTNTINAQTNYNPTTIGEALKTLFRYYPTNFKSLYGNERKEKWASFASKLKIPNSVVNRIDIVSSTDWPLFFMSVIPAGNDKEKAIAKQKEICNEVLDTKIIYQKKQYNIVLKADESNLENEKLVCAYKLENAPPEFLEARIIVRLDDAVKKKYKYQFTISMAYVESSYKY